MGSGVPAVPSLLWHGLQACRSESARIASRLLANAPDVAYGVTPLQAGQSGLLHLVVYSRIGLSPFGADDVAR